MDDEQDYPAPETLWEQRAARRKVKQQTHRWQVLDLEKAWRGARKDAKIEFLMLRLLEAERLAPKDPE